MKTHKEKFINLKGNEKKIFFSKLKSYVYAYCRIDKDNRRIPIYIGKGKSDRCLSHLDNLDDVNNQRNIRIKNLIEENKLGIDILAYGLDNQTALKIESVCIDLMGIDFLENEIKGHGDTVKRVPLNELTNIVLETSVKVAPEHKGKGVAILINKQYRPTFGDLELFEITRGMWKKASKTVAGDSKYAYAICDGIVKEAYEIHSWVPAGTQQYFTREDAPEFVKDRWEFVGKKASDNIRQLYVGKLLERQRSHGNPFVRV